MRLGWQWCRGDRRGVDAVRYDTDRRVRMHHVVLERGCVVVADHDDRVVRRDDALLEATRVRGFAGEQPPLATTGFACELLPRALARQVVDLDDPSGPPAR